MKFNAFFFLLGTVCAQYYFGGIDSGYEVAPGAHHDLYSYEQPKLNDDHHEQYNHDHFDPPHYSFKYSVHDPHTGDIKSHHETRKGDAVKGFYTLKEADGTTREVHYTSDKHTGFKAVVKTIGQSVHPHSHYKTYPFFHRN